MPLKSVVQHTVFLQHLTVILTFRSWNLHWAGQIDDEINNSYQMEKIQVAPVYKTCFIYRKGGTYDDTLPIEPEAG